MLYICIALFKKKYLKYLLYRKSVVLNNNKKCVVTRVLSSENIYLELIFVFSFRFVKPLCLCLFLFSQACHDCD